MPPRLVLSASMMTVATFFGPLARAMPSEGTEVLRAQIEVSVCDLKGAGTSDPVSARLTEGEGKVTWLGSPVARFQRDERDRFDLLLDDVRTLSDISELVIQKPGSDDLCIREVRLIVNDQTIFFRTFGAGVWLNEASHNALRTTAAELRANASWQGYGWSLTEWLASTGAVVSRDALVDHLTSAVSTAMADLGLAWKNPPDGSVVVRRSDSVTVHASTMLTRVGPAWFATDIALEFDLRLCANARAEPALVRVATRQARPWFTMFYSRERAEDDTNALATLRARLHEMRPIVLAGDVCPHADPVANISYE